MNAKFEQWIRAQLTELIKEAEQSLLHRSNRRFDDWKDCGFYFRVGKRLINNDYAQCLQLASISIVPKLQKRGIFKSTFAVMQEFNMPLYVESVQNEDFAVSLVKRGFVRISDNTGLGTNNYYRLVTSDFLIN